MKEEQNLIFKPQFGNLLLAEIKTADRVGHIYLPSNVRKPSNQGRIIAKGDDVPEGKGFEIGCVVVYPKFVDHEIQLNQETEALHVVNFTDIILSDFGHFAMLQEKEQNAKKTS